MHRLCQQEPLIVARSEGSCDRRALAYFTTIDAGEIGVEEGMRRLEALADRAVANGSPPSRPALVRYMCHAILLAGAAIMTCSAFLLLSYYTQEATLSRLVWGWLVSAVGVAVIMAAWWLYRAPWLFLRVRDRAATTITLAFPLPLGLLVTLVRKYGHCVPQLQGIGLDEILLALKKAGCCQPLWIEVNEEDGAEIVQLYLG